MKPGVPMVATLPVATLLLLATALTACAAEAPPSPTATETPTKSPETREEVGGRELYVSKGCAACHGQNAEGSEFAPALPGHNEMMVKRQVRNPRFRMPAFSEEQITADELEAIAGYIASLPIAGHAHPETIELTEAVEMHHWMALEALKANDRGEAIHHVDHTIDLLGPGQHHDRMVAIVQSLQAGEAHEAEHAIEETLAGTAAPDLTLFQLHLRQALVSLAVNERADAQHHLEHAQGLAEPDDDGRVHEALEALEQAELHQSQHEIQELLGEDEQHD